jgi:tape measure domain-containing protein
MIDSQVVEMIFNGSNFDAGVSKTISGLATLKNILNFGQQTDPGLQKISEHMSKMPFHAMTEGLHAVTSKFSAMGVAGMSAIQNITSRMTNAGVNLAKSLTIAPINDGFKEYEMNMNSIQTILANTAKQGTTLKQVGTALDELNEYSDQTIYNFADMTKNIGAFTSAGVNLDTSVASIKGLANVAAMSGASSENASRAMYQLSQAIASGTVRAQDWSSVVTADMGSQVFQDALIKTAKVHGKNVDSMIKKNGGFRQSLEEGWLSSQIMTETLETFTGDLSDAQLKSMGYSAKQIVEIQKTAKIAKGAATEVKTFSAFLDTTKQTIGSGWSTTFRTVIGDFEEAKKLWTDVNNAVGGFFQKSANERNTMLASWKQMGGRTELLAGLKESFAALGAVLRPIGEAFRMMFPKKTAADLMLLTDNFKSFADSLKVSSKTASSIRHIFQGVFSIFSLGGYIIRRLAGIFVDMFKTLTGGGNAGKALSTLARLGDFFTELNYNVQNGIGIGKSVDKFFDVLGKAAQYPMKAINGLISLLGRLWKSFRSSGEEEGDGQSRLEKFVGNIGEIGSKLRAAMDGLTSGFRESLRGFFTAPGDVVPDYGAIQGLLSGGVLAIAAKTIQSTYKGLLPAPKIGGILDNLTNVFKNMSLKLKADALLRIGAAILVLAIAFVILSGVDAAGLTRAGVAMAGLIGALGASMKLFAKAVPVGEVMKLQGLSMALLAIAGAILILSIAVLVLSTMSWTELAKGLLGVVAIMAGLAGMVKLMGSPKRLFFIALGIMMLSTAIMVLVAGVALLAMLDPLKLLQGIVAVGLLIGGIILLSKFMQKVPMGGGLALKAMAAGVGLLVDAVIKLGSMSLASLAAGLIGMGVAIGIITFALDKMPPGIEGKAYALGAVASSMTLLADAVKKMGELSIADLGQGLAALGLSILILSNAIGTMSKNILGAIALVIVATALGLLAPALAAIAAISMLGLATALITIGLAIGLLALGLKILTPMIPTMLAMAWAMLLVGAAGAALGLGMLMFATGLALVVGLGAAASGAIVAIGQAVITLVPMLGIALANAMVSFIIALASMAPRVAQGMLKIVITMLKVLNQYIPIIVNQIMIMLTKMLQVMTQRLPAFIAAAVALIVAFINGIAKSVDKVVTAIVNLIVAILNAIAKNISKIITAGTNIIIAFIKGMGNAATRLVTAAGETILKFLNALADAIDQYAPQIREAAKRIASSLINGLTGGLQDLWHNVTDKVSGLVNKIPKAIRDMLGINSPSRVTRDLGHSIGEGFALGISDESGRVTKQTRKFASISIDEMRKAMDDISKTMDLAASTEYTITPVIDFGEMKKGVSNMDSFFGRRDISLKTSYNDAQALKSSLAAMNSQAYAEASNPTEIVFNQYNNSPKALSSSEIYRQTKNHISRAKGVLSSNA